MKATCCQKSFFRLILIILSFAAIHLTCQSTGYKQGTQTQTIEYHGIRPTDPDGRKGLLIPANPCHIMAGPTRLELTTSGLTGQMPFLLQ